MNKNQKIIMLAMTRIFDENRNIPIDMDKIKYSINEALIHDCKETLTLNDVEVHKIEQLMIDIFNQVKRIN